MTIAAGSAIAAADLLLEHGATGAHGTIVASHIAHTQLASGIGTNTHAQIDTFITNVTGMIFPYGGTAAPTGYLLCDGASYGTATYPALYAVIGTAFGGSGTVFSVPDIQGRFLVGKGTHANVDAIGDSDGGTVVSNRTPNHTHAQNYGTTFASEASLGNVGASSNSDSDMFTHTGSGGLSGYDMKSGVVSGGGAYITVNYVIKT